LVFVAIPLSTQH